MIAPQKKNPSTLGKDKNGYKNLCVRGLHWDWDSVGPKTSQEQANFSCHVGGWVQAVRYKACGTKKAHKY